MTNEEAANVLLGLTDRERFLKAIERIVRAYDEKRLISWNLGVCYNEVAVLIKFQEEKF